MHRALLLVLLAAMDAACLDASSREVTCGEAVPVTAMSYNLANQTGASGQKIAAHIAAAAPDFVGVQECSDCEWFLEQLAGDYQITASARAGVAILYRAWAWQLEDRGVLRLGENDDGWGERVAMWARFAHRDTGHCLYVYSTHWCVPIRNPDDACDEERQLDYAAAMVDHLVTREVAQAPALLAGDFNVFDGFEQGRVVRALLDGGLVDAFRALNPDLDGTTFQGNSWAPAGRIDYIFATPPVEVLDSTIDRDSIPAGEGSDHFAVSASVRFADPGDGE